MTHHPIRGVLFDLDGTLVDSRLDFDLMRQEMNLPAGVPILETLADLPVDEAERCREILARHELDGAARAFTIPGVREFLERLDARAILRGVFTRNTRVLALAVLARLELPFELVISRDDGPIKPDPAAIWKTCELWGLSPAEVLVIGDYHYDLEAGRRAGSPTVLYTAGRDPARWPWAGDADFILHSFEDAESLLFGSL